MKCWQAVHLDEARTHCLNVCYVFTAACLHAFLGSLGVISAWKDLYMFVFCGSKGKRSKNVNLMTSCGQKDADVRQRESEYLGLLIIFVLFCFAQCVCVTLSLCRTDRCRLGRAQEETADLGPPALQRHHPT